MGEVVRWPEQHSSHLHDSSTVDTSIDSPDSDQDLLTRIRSLYLSRNSHFPPRTPCASPDFSIHQHDCDLKRTEFAQKTAHVSRLNIDRSIAKLAQLEFRSRAMVVKLRDGPAGQIADFTTGMARRQTSQPDMQDKESSSIEDSTSTLEQALDHKSLGTTMGQDLIGQSANEAIIPKSTLGTRIPKHVLRTLTPSDQVHSNMPGAQRSFTSEFKLNLTSKARAEKSLVSAELVEPKLEHSHTNIDPQQSALGSLNDFRNHHPSISDPAGADRSIPTLGTKLSQSTLNSTISAKVACHPLLQVTPDLQGTSRPVEPILTADIVHGQSHATENTTNVDQEPPLSLTTDSHDIVETSQSPTREDPAPPGIRLYGLSSNHITRLSAEVAPYHDDGAYYVKSQSSFATDRDGSLAQLRFGSYSPSVYSRRSSLRFGSKSHSRRSSRSHMKRTRASSLIEDDRIELLSKQHNDEDEKSISSDRITAISRALSLLSDVSLQPVLPSPSSETKRLLQYFENEAIRLERSPSLPPILPSGNGNEAANPRYLARQPPLLPKGSYLGSSSANSMADTNNSDHKHHWVRHLLGMRSSAARSSSSPNLTRLPQRRHTEASALMDRANILPSRRGMEATADGTHSQKQVTDSTDPIAMHSENNESFSKIIAELEVLLKEALSIARQAAEKDANPGYREIVEEDEDDTIQGSFGDRPHFKNSWRREGSNAADTGNKGKEIHINIVEPGLPKSQGSFKKLRDVTPYPPASAVQTRHTSMAPGSETKMSVTDHAKDVAALLNLPPPMNLPPVTPTTELINGETLVHFTIGNSSIVRQVSKASDIGVPRISVVMDPDICPGVDNRYEPFKPVPYPRAIVEPVPQRPAVTRAPSKDQQIHVSRKLPAPESLPRDDVRENIKSYHGPPIQPRNSSARLNMSFVPEEGARIETLTSSDDDPAGDTYLADFHQYGIRSRKPTRQWTGDDQRARPGLGPGKLPQQDTITSLKAPRPRDNEDQHGALENTKGYSLKDRHHFSIRGPQGFSLSRSHRRAPIARDWSTRRKRYVAAVACLNTALLGVLIGIYAGEVPAIQYVIVDLWHYTILGNVMFYIGMSIPTILFFPLPLLHGRKPYTLAALGLLVPLQFPSVVAVENNASPSAVTYRNELLLSRAFCGLVAGFANINLITTLLDLFGASLQSGNPHQETVNENDVRRHGGGMGVWLGVWTWCSIGSIGLGFLIGASIIDKLPVTWGFWISIIITATVLLLNVITPEVRRSPYRRSMAEVATGLGEISRRIARGEVKMHLYSTGPKHWWEEVVAGHVLCIRMLKQPGFLILSLYIGWIYGQIVMIVILLGALTSRYYMFHAPYVGLCVAAIPLGALLAIPFQKASFFSRARHHRPRTDSMTFEKRLTWTSHLVRRSIFMIVLPFAGLAYTLASGGTHIPFIVPTIFAGLIGFLSNLAIAECNGIIMETFDTSDLQPGMTGRPRRILPEDVRKKRTNFSCFPRVTAAFAITQTFSFLIAAAATGTCGAVERQLGAQAATGIVAGVLLILTLLLIGVLTRWKTVQVVPDQRYGTNVLGGPEDEWKPVIIGHPSGTTRRVSVLEMGEMTRWTEIRRRNRLLNS